MKIPNNTQFQGIKNYNTISRNRILSPQKYIFAAKESVLRFEKSEIKSQYLQSANTDSSLTPILPSTGTTPTALLGKTPITLLSETEAISTPIKTITTPPSQNISSNSLMISLPKSLSVQPNIQLHSSSSATTPSGFLGKTPIELLTGTEVTSSSTKFISTPALPFNKPALRNPFQTRVASKSNNTKCNGCKNRIIKGKLFIKTENGNFHFACFGSCDQ